MDTEKREKMEDGIKKELRGLRQVEQERVVRNTQMSLELIRLVVTELADRNLADFLLGQFRLARDMDRDLSGAEHHLSAARALMELLPEEHRDLLQRCRRQVQLAEYGCLPGQAPAPDRN